MRYFQYSLFFACSIFGLIWLGYLGGYIYEAITKQPKVICEKTYKVEYDQALKAKEEIEIDNTKLQKIANQCIAGLREALKNKKP